MQTEETVAKKPMGRGKAMSYIFICAALWSSGGVLVKSIDMNPFVLAFFRSLFALFMLLVIYRPRNLRFTKKVWIAAIPAAVLGMSYVIATKLTTAANAIVIEYSSPVFIILFSRIFFKERVLRADVLVSIACISGMALFFLDELSPGNMLGNCVAIISGIANAAFFMMMSRTSEHRGTINIASQIESMVICLPFVLLYPPQFTLQSMVAVILLGAVQRGLSIMFFAKGAPHCSAMDATLISMAEPLCNPLLVMLVYGERPGKFALLGGAVIIVSVLLWNIAKMKALAGTEAAGAEAAQ